MPSPLHIAASLRSAVAAAVGSAVLLSGCGGAAAPTPSTSGGTSPVASAPASAPASSPHTSTAGPASRGATGGTASSSAAPAGSSQVSAATAMAQDLEAGKADSIMAHAGSTLKQSGLTAQMLVAGRSQVDGIAGDYRRIVGAFRTAAPGGDVVCVVADHAKQPVRFLFSFESGTELLNGVNLNIATSDDVANASAAATPGSSASSAEASTSGTSWPSTGTHSTDTAVSVGARHLPGTLTTPASGTPRRIVVILLPGSGPQDRDETIGAAQNKPLRDIADGLAARGISSLRYDKRTKAAAASWTASSTIADEYLDDAASAVALLAARPELAGYRIYVAGHSQGAMVMPTILAANPQLAGGVSLAGSPRSLFDIMYDQNVQAVDANAALTATQKKAALAQARALFTQAKALTDPDGQVPQQLAPMMSAAYVVSLNRLTPVADARKTGKPLLFLQGDADQQVNLTRDFGAWKADLAGRASTTFHDYPGLNHLFMPTTGKPVPADYDAAARVAPAVISDLATWLESH